MYVIFSITNRLKTDKQNHKKDKKEQGGLAPILIIGHFLSTSSIYYDP